MGGVGDLADGGGGGHGGGRCRGAEQPEGAGSGLDHVDASDGDEQTLGGG